jgi:formylglycine-generating enzyme required for sulfatase activity
MGPMVRSRAALPLLLVTLLLAASGCSPPEGHVGQVVPVTAQAVTEATVPPTAVPSSIADPSPPMAATLLPTSTTSLTPEMQAGQVREHQLPGDTVVEMVYVPAGTLAMGSDAEGFELAEALCDQYPDGYGKCQQDLFAVEGPQHPVPVAGFWIDRTEVTNKRYGQCVAAGVCTASRLADDPAYNGDDYPVAGIPWQAASEYCAWAGARLPTEAEWEYAARGEAGEVFPWGSAYECGRANLWADCSGCEDGYDGPAPVSAFPAGASWCGALDMAGNVWEWVADRFTEYPGASDDSPAESDGTRVLRGGSWGYCPAFARAAYRYPVPAGADYLAVGFRCAISAGEAGPAR